MPQVITRSGRYAIRFVHMGDDIVLEERVPRHRSRHSHDGRSAQAQCVERRRRSAGRRDDGTARSLVVTTTAIDLALLPALRPRRRSAEQRDDDRRALHAERRRHASSTTTSRRRIRARSRARSRPTATARSAGSPVSSSCRRTACSNARLTSGHSDAIGRSPRAEALTLRSRAPRQCSRSVGASTSAERAAPTTLSPRRSSMPVSFPSDCGRRRTKGDSHDRSQRAALRCVPPQPRATTEAREGSAEGRQGRRRRRAAAPARRRVPDAAALKLAQAQHCIARELRFANWADLKRHIGEMERARHALDALVLDDDCRTMHIRCGHRHPARAAGSGAARRLQRPHQSISAGPGHRHARLARAARAVHRRRDRSLSTARLRDRARGRARRGAAAGRGEPRLRARRVVARARPLRPVRAAALPRLVRRARRSAAARARRAERFSRRDAVRRARATAAGGAAPALGAAPTDQRRATRLRPRIWQAFRAADPRALAALARDGTPLLPALAGALHRHLQELPSVANGLGLTHQLLLQALAEDGTQRAGRLVGLVMHDRDPLPGLGDMGYDQALRELAALPEAARAAQRRPRAARRGISTRLRSPTSAGPCSKDDATRSRCRCPSVGSAACASRRGNATGAGTSARALSSSGNGRIALLRPAETKHEAIGLAAHGRIEHVLREIVGGVTQHVALRCRARTRPPRNRV